MTHRFISIKWRFGGAGHLHLHSSERRFSWRWRHVSLKRWCPLTDYTTPNLRRLILVNAAAKTWNPSFLKLVFFTLTKLRSEKVVASVAGFCWRFHSWLFENAASNAVLVQSSRSALQLFSRTVVRSALERHILSTTYGKILSLFSLICRNICAFNMFHIRALYHAK
jgi:hypothetical protein